MNIRALLAGSTFAALLAVPAFSATDEVINQIVQTLAAQGYQRIEIVNAQNRVKVEAWGPDGKVEQVYDGQGVLVREQMHDGETLAAGGPSAQDDDSADDQSDDSMDDQDDDDSASSDNDHGDQSRDRVRDSSSDDDHEQSRDRNRDGGNGGKHGDDD